MSKVTVYSEGDHKNHTAANHRTSHWIRLMLGKTGREEKRGKEEVSAVFATRSERSAKKKWEGRGEEVRQGEVYRGPKLPPPICEITEEASDLHNPTSSLISLLLATGHLWDLACVFFFLIGHIWGHNPDLDQLTRDGLSNQRHDLCLKFDFTALSLSKM